MGFLSSILLTQLLRRLDVWACHLDHSCVATRNSCFACSRHIFVRYWSTQRRYGLPSTTRLKLVQQRFTKCIAGYYHLSYQECLARLQLPSLKLRRDLLTACLIYKILHNHIDITPQSVGLYLSCNNTRSGGIELHVPRSFCSAFKCSFMFRAASLWNSAALQAPSLLSFKMQLLRYWGLEGAW